MAAASAITPTASSARVVVVGVGPSATQNTPPSGSRDRLSRLGRLVIELEAGSDMQRRAAYQRPARRGSLS